MEVKICGIKSAFEALSVVNLGIDYAGVIFANSPRKVNLQTAQEIAQIAHDAGIKCVGVFAGISEDEILEISANASLDAVQIYGGISESLYDSLNFSDIEVWKVFSVSDSLPDLKICEYDMALFDCKGAKLGGNGTSFNWEILKGLKPFSFGLAGGIGIHNAKKAASFKPRVIDINSLVEDENGLKDPEKIREILAVI